MRKFRMKDDPEVRAKIAKGIAEAKKIPSKTVNGIYYSEEIGSANGLDFVLWAVETTPQEKLDQAERILKEEYDADEVYVIFVPAEMLSQKE